MFITGELDLRVPLMAATPPHFNESFAFQNPADVDPERIRRLPNRGLDARDEDFGVQPSRDFSGVR